MGAEDGGVKADKETLERGLVRMNTDQRGSIREKKRIRKKCSIRAKPRFSASSAFQVRDRRRANKKTAVSRGFLCDDLAAQ